MLGPIDVIRQRIRREFIGPVAVREELLDVDWIFYERL
jgi:hypothetical protein